MKPYTPFKTFLVYTSLGHFHLAGKIHNGYGYFGAEGCALYGPFAGVAANVEHTLRVILKHTFQYIGEGIVLVEVIESKPAFLYLLGQLGECLVDGGPVAKNF